MDRLKARDKKIERERAYDTKKGVIKARVNERLIELES